MERMNLWVSSSHSSCTVVTGGVERSASGRNFAAVFEAMAVEDRGVLVAFCWSVLAAAGINVRALSSDEGGR